MCWKGEILQKGVFAFKKRPHLLVDNRFLILFSRIPERFRWIVTGITAVSIVMLWYVFLYVPKKYFVQAPPLLSYEKLIDHVVYLAQKAHLSYDCTTSRIVLEGTFRDVQRFFAHAIRINGLVDVQKITCHRLANNQIKVTVVHA